MYKLIIVDDEPIIIECLEKIINWNELGFEIAGTFTDGRYALEFLKNNAVDVVVSDIKMSVVSGILLSKYIFENKIKTKVILMSAYKEFEYARDAIKYNVNHYILKPIDMDEFREIILSVKDSLDEKNTELTEQKQENNFDYVVALVQKQFFSDVFIGALKIDEKINAQLKILDININSEEKNCKILKIAIENYKSIPVYSVYLFYSRLYEYFNIKSQMLDTYIVMYKDENIYVMVMNKHNISVDYRHLMEEIIEKIRVCENMNLKISQEGEWVDFRNIGISLKNYSDVIYSDILISYINEGDILKASTYVNSFIENYKDDFTKLSSTIYKLFESVKNEIFSKETSFDNIININANDKEGLKLDTDAFIGLFVDYTKKNMAGRTNYIINEAIEYIKENFDKPITLEEVANIVYRNPVYFSRLFKKETGSNFSEYVLKLRIEKAKEYLKKEEYKIYDISEMVGYSSIQYFRKIFKEYTGLTPIEYRQCGGNETK